MVRKEEGSFDSSLYRARGQAQFFVKAPNIDGPVQYFESKEPTVIKSWLSCCSGTVKLSVAELKSIFEKRPLHLHLIVSSGIK